MKRVMVFGAFDGLHPGHAHMLGEAKALGDELIVCLATDASIRRLKRHEPQYAFADRKAALELLPIVDYVITGDNREGEYTGITTEEPDIVAFGYDQEALHTHCTQWIRQNGLHIHTVTLTPFEPHTYKSSLLRNKNV